LRPSALFYKLQLLIKKKKSYCVLGLHLCAF
jgi:hypothetical protein